MRNFILIFLMAGWGAGGFAQAPLVKQWDRRYGGTLNDVICVIRQTIDNGFILGGYSGSGIGGDKTQANWDGTLNTEDYWIVKIDSVGNKEWDKRFGGIDHDQLWDLNQTTDGGYILGGFSESEVGGDKTQSSWGLEDYWIVKIDSAGNKQWDKRFGGSLIDQCFSLQQTNDGGYILGGTTLSDSGYDRTQPLWGGIPDADYWVVKIDSVGNKQWDKRYGGNLVDRLFSLVKTTDNGYILGGQSISYPSGDKTQPSQGGTDYWVIKIDSSGNKEWDKRFGGSNQENFTSLLQTKDKGYILCGFTNSGATGDKTQANQDTSFYALDIWIVKIDSIGNKQWDKKFGGLAEDGGWHEKIIQTLDGGYLVSTTSESGANGDKSENNLGVRQVWVVKIDSVGNKIWDKTIFTAAFELFCYAIQSQDSCYMIAASTYGPVGGDKTQPSWNGSSDYWVIKFCDTMTVRHCNLIASISAGQAIFCSGDSTQICAPLGNSYHWNTGELTACIKVMSAGNYYVTVTDGTGCTAESNRIAISVYPQPPVSISANGDTLRVYNAASQQWFLNGSAITGATDSIYIATQGGSYTVQVTDTNGCTATSTPVIITGIEGITEADILSVFPNPNAAGEWMMVVGENLLGGTAGVFDASGKLVFQQLITNHQSLIIPQVARGVYLLRVSSSKGTVIRKLICL